MFKSIRGCYFTVCLTGSERQVERDGGMEAGTQTDDFKDADVKGIEDSPLWVKQWEFSMTGL